MSSPRRRRTGRSPAPLRPAAPVRPASGWGGLAAALRSPRFALGATAAAVGAGVLTSLASGHAAGLPGSPAAAPQAAPVGVGSGLCQAPSIKGATAPGPQGQPLHYGSGSTTVVTVAGAGFAQTGCSVTAVTVGAARGAGIAVDSDASLRFTAPAGASGPVNVTLTDSLGNQVTSQGTYTFVSAPTVAAVSPATVVEGGTLTDSGNGLTLSGLPGETVSAQFAGCSGPASSPVSLDSDTGLHLSAPGGYCGGAVTLVFSVPYNTASGATDPPITVPVAAGSVDVAAVVGGVSPNGAVVAGGQVSVTGTGFGGAGSASLSGAAAAVAWADRTITVTVPDTAGSGPLVLRRAADGAQVGPSSGGSVQAPQIAVQARLDTVSPSPVAPGETLVLSGGGFGSSGSVSLGGQALSVQSWTPTEIRAVVPQGTVTGALHVVPDVDAPPDAAPVIGVGDVVAANAANPNGPQHTLTNTGATLAGPSAGTVAGQGPGSAPPPGGGGAPGAPRIPGGGAPGLGPVTGAAPGASTAAGGGAGTPGSLSANGGSYGSAAGAGANTTLVTPAVVPTTPAVPLSEWALFGCLVVMVVAFAGYRRLVPIPAGAGGAAGVLRDPGAALLSAVAGALRRLPTGARWWEALRRSTDILLALALIFVYLMASVILLGVVLLLLFHSSGSAVFYTPEGAYYRGVAAVLSVALTAIALRYAYYYRCWYSTRHHFGHPKAVDAAALGRRDLPFMKFQVTTKGGALPVVERSLRELEAACARHDWLPSRICAEVITEIPEEAAHLEQAFAGSALEVRGICLPADYSTPNGTLLKARALHYMVEQRRAGFNVRPGRTYIVHLDEETLVTEPHLLVLIEYLAGTPRPVSQGPIFYPLEWNKAPWICRSLECTRPFGCSECARVMENPPPPHLHGSNLVVEERVENRIGWDFGTLDGHAYVAEDLLFGLRAYALLGRDCFGWHGATMLEQPPLSLYWAVQQRMRWVLGALQGMRAMWRAAEYEAMAARDKLRLSLAIGFRIATYSLGFPIGLTGLAYVLHPLNATSINWASPVAAWRLMLILSAVGWFVSYQIGVLRNLRYQQVSMLERVRGGAVMLVMTPVTGLCETVGPFIALVRWLLGIRGARWTPTPKLAGGAAAPATERNPRRLGHGEVAGAPVAGAGPVEEVELTGTPTALPGRRVAAEDAR